MSISRITLGSIIPLILVACSAGPGAAEKTAQTDAPLTTAIGQIKSTGGLCLDVVGDNQAAGAAVDIATCNGTAAQTFTYQPTLPGQQPILSGPIMNTESGMCLDDVSGGGKVLQMKGCNGSAEQTWTFSGFPGEGGATITDGPGHCLDVLGDTQKSGQTVDPATCNGTPAQGWTYTLPGATITTPTNGPFSTQITSAGLLCLDVVGNNPSPGAMIDISRCNGTTAQAFTFNPAVPGPVVDTATGLCLEDAFEADMIMDTCNGLPEQTWTFNGWPASSTITDGFGRCLDVLDNDQTSGQKVDPGVCNLTSAQNWSYVLPCAPGRVHGNDGLCTCNTTNYDVSVGASMFNLWVASQLTELKVTGTDNSIKVTMPPGSNLNVSAPAPISISIPNVTINSLDMPSGYMSPPGTFTWSMSPDSADITVTTTLDANIVGNWNGVDGVGACTATVQILSAPVTIVLSSTYSYEFGMNVLQVQSVSIPLTGGKNGNTDRNGCTLMPEDDLLGLVQGNMQSALQKNLNGTPMLNLFMDNVVQAMATALPGGVGLSPPEPTSPGFTWGCGQASMTTGAIAGRCSYECN